MSECGEWIKVEYSGTTARIIDARYCRDRACPTCAWRRSRKNLLGMLEVYDSLHRAHPTARWVLCTLTVRNVAPSDLGDTIDAMLHAWDKLSRRRTWRACWQGWARSMEVTYNADADTMHPHLHLLLMATPEYYRSEYINQPTLADMWQAALGVDYTPIVDIRAVEDTPANSRGAVEEVTKYLTKPALLPVMPRATLGAWLVAVQGRRLLSMGGVVASTARALRWTPDDDNGEVEERDAIISTSDTSGTLILRWSYSGSAYFVQEV